MNPFRKKAHIVAATILATVLFATSAVGLANPQIRFPKNKEAIVYVTRTGKKYHRSSCRHLAKSSIPMKLSEARQYYDPCKVCGPP